ncbi:50S ribosomal protein L29, partial [Dysosmobacter welbionis]
PLQGQGGDPPCHRGPDGRADGGLDADGPGRSRPDRSGEAAEDVPGIPGELGPDGPVRAGAQYAEEPQADEHP